MTSAQEIGARLQEMAREISGIMVARRQAIAEDLEQMLEQESGCKQTIENPLEEVVRLLGENHRGYDAIVGATSEVDDRLDKIYQATLLVVRELETLPNVVDNLAIVYTNVGAAVAGGHL